jgi:Kef-type K+ transport system membrane component KefB
LTFSSTIIITKLLYDKQDLETLYGKIAIGVLIVQDLVAIFALMAAPYFSSADKLASISPGFLSILYSILIFPTLIFASIYVLPGITKFVAKNQELLFLFSVGWVFLLASVFAYLGFSMEIGALLAGISLSVSPYHYEIASKIKPLRDFFLIIFFIFLGLNFNVANISTIIKPVLILSTFVILFKLIVIMTSLGFLGYTKRTSFIAGLTLGQISEFSFILVGLGFALGQIPAETVQIITLTGLITIAVSTYFITYCDKIYPLFSPYLKIFEKKSAREKKITKEKPETILFGYNRIGYSMLKSFSKLKKHCLIVDFNPETITRISRKGIASIYGDAGDSELLDEIKIQDAKLVISTVPNEEDNLLIIKKIRAKNTKSIVIVTARRIDHAVEAYDAGADYVILPHFLGGEYISHLVERFEFNKKLYEKEKQKHLKDLKDRIFEGHEHPEVTRG